MKKILAEAINGIDWHSPESINYLIHNKGEQKSFFVENILQYLGQVKKLNFLSKKLIDGIRKQKVDIIEVNNAIESNHFIIDEQTKEKVAIARIVDIGLCVLHQPSDYNINKTLTDINKRTVKQKLSNDYFTLQIVLDITKPNASKQEESNIDGNDQAKERKLKDIDNDYNKLDPDHIKLYFQLNDGANNIDVNFYICGPFNTNSWEGIKTNFADYKTPKGKSLDVLKF